MLRKKNLSYIFLSIIAVLLSCTGLFIGDNDLLSTEQFEEKGFIADAYSSYSELYYSYTDFSSDYDGSTLPAEYCLRDEYMLYTQQQASQGLCWAFGSQTALSTTIMKATGEWLDFSESWISIALTYALNYEGFSDYANTLSGSYLPGGGGYYCSVDLIARKYGLVLEQDCGFEDSSFLTKENTQEFYEFYSKYANTNIMDNIEGGRFLLYNNYASTAKTKIINSMKQHILNNGAIEAGMYWEDYVDEIYNGEAITYKIPSTTANAGHLVTLIGWDDNFSVTYEGTAYTGAWIALNSWGDDLGYDGITYLLYDDTDFNSAFFGWKYTEDTTQDTYFLTTMNDATTGDYTTDKVGAYYGDFSAEEGQTLQQNIFYNVDDVTLVYDYTISTNTQISSTKVIKSDGEDVTRNFDIDVTSNQITYTASDVAVGSYKIVTIVSNATTGETKEYLNAFYVTDGMEIGYGYLYTANTTVSNQGRFQNFNSLYTGSKDFYYATTNTSGNFYMFIIKASYSDILRAVPSSGISIYDAGDYYQLYIQYNFSSSTINHFTITFYNSQNKSSVMNFYIQKTVSGNAYPNLLIETNGGTLNGEELKRLVVSQSSGGKVPTPTREGYDFKGWYYSDDFTSANKLSQTDGEYYIDYDKIINYSSSTVDWQSAFNSYYDHAEVVFLYADWEVSKYTITASVEGGGSISPSGDVEVEYGQNQTFTFLANAGNAISSIYVDGVELTGTTLTNAIANGYTFENVTQNHTIKLVCTANSYSITASCSVGGSISPSGHITITEGLSQTFTFSPNEGYYLSGVTVDGTALDATALADALANGYTFQNVSQNHEIEATFAIQTFTITASKSGSGTISPIGAKTLNYGGMQKYTFTPNEGQKVVSIIIDGEELTGDAYIEAYNNGYYIFENVTENHTITVHFATIYFQIVITHNEGGTVSPDGNVSVAYGESQTITITPNEGYMVSKIVVNGIETTPTNRVSFSNVTSHKTLDITFDTIKFAINASSTGNGTISPEGSVMVVQGESQAFTFSAGEGYHIASIIVDGIALEGEEMAEAFTNGYTFTNVQGIHSIKAVYEIDTFAISVVATGNGTISPAGEQIVNYGQNKTFSFTPNEGYKIKEIIVDGQNMGVLTSYTFENVKETHSIEAIFERIYFTLTIVSNEGGIVTPNGNVQIGYGDSQIITITPNEHFNIDKILLDGSEVEISNTVTLTDVKKDYNLQIKFIEIFTITSVVVGEGTTTPTTEVLEGGQLKIEFFPAEGYKVKNVEIDGVSVGAVEFYIFIDVNSSHTITVEFAIKTFTISLSVDGKGEAKCTETLTSVKYGSERTITITPNAGWKVYKVYVDGIAQTLKDDTLTLLSITEDMTVQVIFERGEDSSQVDGTMIAIIVVGVVIVGLLVVLIMKKGKKPPKNGDKKEVKPQTSKNATPKQEQKQEQVAEKTAEMKTVQQKPQQSKEIATEQRPQAEQTVTKTEQKTTENLQQTIQKTEEKPQQFATEPKKIPTPPQRPIPPRPPVPPTRPIPPKPPVQPQSGTVNQKALERAQAFKKSNGENKQG